MTQPWMPDEAAYPRLPQLEGLKPCQADGVECRFAAECDHNKVRMAIQQAFQHTGRLCWFWRQRTQETYYELPEAQP